MAQPCPARGGHNCPLKLGRTSPLLLQGCGFAMAAGCSPGAFRAACGAPKRVAEFLAELCCQDLPSPWPPPCTQAPEEPVWALWAEWPPPPHTQPCGEATKGRTGREVPSSVGTRVPCCCCCCWGGGGGSVLPGYQGGRVAWGLECGRPLPLSPDQTAPEGSNSPRCLHLFGESGGSTDPPLFQICA